LVDRAVVVIANERTLGPASLRWKGQLNENSKHLAWASPLPEMNHNEVDGYASPTGLVGAFAAVLLRDSGDHPRVQARFRWLERYLAGRGVHVETVDAPGGDPMSRVLGCVALGDWVSYYLALLHGSDPSALPGVTSLKKALSA
jgi:glucose/mannose-6-phosphate isomerase